MINKIISAIDNTIENKLKFLDSHKSFSRNRDWPLNRHVNFQIFRKKKLLQDMILILFIENQKIIHING